jgi:hypothetical protein
VFTKDISEAKKIFLSYNGSHFFMERGGDFKKYKKYRISPKKEYEWIEEYQREILFKVKNNEVPVNKLIDLCSTIRQYHTLDIAKDLLEAVEEKKQSSDTFSLLLIAESINNLAENSKKKKQYDEEIIILLNRYSADLLNWLYKQPITVDSMYFERTYLEGTLEEWQIKKRIKNDLDLLNEKYLNILYDAALEFGSNWRRPLNELANERLPQNSHLDHEQLCVTVENARASIEKYIEEHFDYEKGLTIPESNAILWIQQNFPWMNKKNISLAISQGMYYAWHG